jgi:DNA invertase Pin-like site-specific DNA recombinase
MSRSYDEEDEVIDVESGGTFAKIVEPGLVIDEPLEIIWKNPRVCPDKVLELHYQGKSRNAIANDFSCSRATISKILKSKDLLN